MVLGIDSVVVLVEYVGVFYIGCCIFQIVQVQQVQIENIFVDGGFIFIWGIVCCLMLQVVQIVVDQLQVGDWVVDCGVGIDCQVLCFQCFMQGNCLVGVVDDVWGIEVNVSQGGEEGVGGKVVDLMIDNVIFVCFKCSGGQVLQ